MYKIVDLFGNEQTMLEQSKPQRDRYYRITWNKVEVVWLM